MILVLEVLIDHDDAIQLGLEELMPFITLLKPFLNGKPWAGMHVVRIISNKELDIADCKG
jgi:hypothetical protein